MRTLQNQRAGQYPVGTKPAVRQGRSQDDNRIAVKERQALDLAGAATGTAIQGYNAQDKATSKNNPILNAFQNEDVSKWGIMAQPRGETEGPYLAATPLNKAGQPLSPDEQMVRRQEAAFQAGNMGERNRIIEQRQAFRKNRPPGGYAPNEQGDTMAAQDATALLNPQEQGQYGAAMATGVREAIAGNASERQLSPDEMLVRQQKAARLSGNNGQVNRLQQQRQAMRKQRP